MRFYIENRLLVMDGEWPENMTDNQAIDLCVEKFKIILEEVERTGLIPSWRATASCALCVLYFRHGCKECPVVRGKGYYGCFGTPYSRITHDQVEQNVDDIKLHLQDEIKFLNSLRVEEQNESRTI
jgi:hypothetical protein